MYGMTSVIGIEVMTLSSMRYLSQQVYLIVETHRPLYITEVTNNYKFFIPNVDWVSEKRDDFDGNIFTRI